ncbi:MAG TPA: NAD(P)H-dependent oxidoreductase [Trueperaceae bacterium]
MDDSNLTRNATTIRLLGVAGSLRRHSLNRALLEAAALLAPPELEVEIFDLSGIPLYNGDIDNDEERPAEVQALKDAVSSSDGLVLATPEYNHGVPGVLKNAIDWVSRPAGRSPLRDKPVAIFGAAPGAFGTVRAQQQLKLVLLSTRARLLDHAGVLVTFAREKLAGDGEIVHAPTREHLRRVMSEISSLLREDLGGRHPAVPTSRRE